LAKVEKLRLNWTKPTNCTRHQICKTAILNRKTETKVGQIRKTKIPSEVPKTSKEQTALNFKLLNHWKMFLSSGCKSKQQAGTSE